MDVELITQADQVLSRCGRPLSPRGSSLVYIPKSFLIQFNFPVTPATAQQTITREITGDTSWCLRAVSMTSSAATALSWHVRLPNGRFLGNELQDVLQIAGYGSYRYLFGPELECPAGSKIEVTLADTNQAVAQPLAILFEGSYAYRLKGSGAGCVPMAHDLAASIPRYLRNFNENIMAACWQQGVGPATPQGFSDEEWVYSAAGVVNLPSGAVLPGATAINVAGPFTAIQTIPIDAGSDFRCRRRMFQVTADATVTGGTILGRMRTGSGYAIDDDYFDLATYVGSAPMPLDWRIKASDSVYVDMQLVDYAGTGNIYLQTYLEGVKRFKRAA